MKMRVALFVWARFPDLIAASPRAEDAHPDPTYTRVSEWVEVDFPDLTDESKRQMQLEALRRDREASIRMYERNGAKAEQEHAEDLKRLDTRIAALEAPSEATAKSG